MVTTKRDPSSLISSGSSTASVSIRCRAELSGDHLQFGHQHSGQALTAVLGCDHDAFDLPVRTQSAERGMPDGGAVGGQQQDRGGDVRRVDV